MKRIILPLLCIIALSCGNPGTEDTGPVYDRNDFFVVDYEEILNNKAQVKLSELTDDIEYVRLETNDNCLLHPRAEYFFTNEFIFIDNSKFILQFDRSGNFIKQIGKPGRGPGEIGLIRQLSVLDEAKQLLVQTNWARKLYYFSYEGEFLESVTVSDVMRIKAIQGNRFIYFDKSAYGFEDYVFALITNDGDTLDVVKNHYKWENETGRTYVVSYHLFNTFYEYGGITSFKTMYNDTVYHACGDSIKPEYLIDLGDYQLPQAYRPEVLAASSRMDFREISKGYRFVTSLEAKERLFIPSAEYQGESRYNMIYDRRSATGKLLVDEDGYPGQIINDIDGGPDFWPLGTVNDSTVYMPVLPHSILNSNSRDAFAEKMALSPEKKEVFLKIMDELNENDNPVLMIIGLKGNKY